MEISMGSPAPQDLERIEQELNGMIGPIGEPEEVPVELLSVVRLALAVEDFDPIHYDLKTAQARGYRGIVAPWPILALLRYNCAHQEEHHAFSFGRAYVHGEDSYEFFEPIVVGDMITVSTAITETRLKQGRSGLLGLVTSERCYTNQLGQLCAVMRTITIRR
jgi:hydroxyacyl-ACP dehydratase HTD2-like protein with hotdog domain